MRERRTIWIGMAVLLAIGLAVRLWGIGTDPLWLDEAYSAYAAEHDLRFLWQVVPLYEGHPPFYYTLLHVWVGLFGSSVLALRALGAVIGIVTLPAMAWAADQAGRWLGWPREQRRLLTCVALGFACLSLAMVEMAHQVRPYPLMILVYAMAIGLLIRFGRRAARGEPVGGGAFVVYLLLLEAMLWLHNMGPLYGLSLTIALAIAVLRRGMRRGEWIWLVGGHALVALFYLPGLLILHAQSAAWRHSTWLRFSLNATFVDRVMGLYGVPGWVGLAAVVLAVLGLLALVRGGRRLAAMLLVLALLPVLLSVVLSLTIVPVFVSRIMAAVAGPAILLMAIGAVAHRRLPIVGLGLAVLLGASMLTGDVQARLGGPVQDWYRTVDWLAHRFRPGDQVFAYPNEGALPLRYALRDKGLPFSVRPIPVDMPALETRHGTHPTGTRGVSSLPPAELHAIATEPATRAVPTIWLLRLGASTYDPGDVFLHELRAGRHVVAGWQSGPIEIVGLRRDGPVRGAK
jgi:uncharacterized membrane protein